MARHLRCITLIAVCVLLTATVSAGFFTKSKEEVAADKAGKAWEQTKDAAWAAADVAKDRGSELAGAAWEKTKEAAAVASDLASERGPELAGAAWEKSKEAGTVAAATAKDALAQAGETVIEVTEAAKDKTIDAAGAAAAAAAEQAAALKDLALENGLPSLRSIGVAVFVVTLAIIAGGYINERKETIAAKAKDLRAAASEKAEEAQDVARDTLSAAKEKGSEVVEAADEKTKDAGEASNSTESFESLEVIEGKRQPGLSYKTVALRAEKAAPADVNDHTATTDVVG